MIVLTMTELDTLQTTAGQPGTNQPHILFRGAFWLLALGDWLALLIFCVIGETNHNMLSVEGLPSLFNTFFSLVVPWTIVAILMGGYHPEKAAGFWSWMGRSLSIWLIAAPLGLVIRALWRGQGVVVLVFMIVALSVGGLFILAWRAVYWWWLSRQWAK